MKTFIAAVWILASALSVGAEAAAIVAGGDGSPVRQSVERGLPYIQARGVAWKEERECASCHHAPMMIWTLGEAGKRGYAVDDKALAEMVEWSFGTPEDAKVLPSPGALNIGVLSLLLGARSLPPEIAPAPTLLKRLTEHVVASQGADGSWVGGGQPPVSPGAEQATPFALIALAGLSVDALPESGALDSATAKAGKWLAENPAGDLNQILVLRLWELVAVGAKSGNGAEANMEAVGAAIQKIKSQQHEDGGWSQTPHMASDAFATGQTVFVLLKTGVMRGDPAIGRGVQFLLKNQAEDGSWPMTSRARPGKEAVKNLEPITYAAAGWAMLALIEAGGAK